VAGASGSGLGAPFGIWCICVLPFQRSESASSINGRRSPDLVSPEFAQGWLHALSEADEQTRTVWVDFDFVWKAFYADCDETTVVSRPSAVADVPLGSARL